MKALWRFIVDFFTLPPWDGTPDTAIEDLSPPPDSWFAPEDREPERVEGDG